MFDTRRLVHLSMLIAMGTVLHLVEAMVAIPLPLPGVKLGLANIVTVIALCLYGVRAGITVAVVRVLLGSLASGLFLSPGFMLSLAGSVTGALIMALLLRKTRCFSIIGISMAGATGHNIGQLLAAALLLQNSAVFYYLPVLILSGIPTGIFTGYLVMHLLDHLRKTGVLDSIRTEQPTAQG